MSRIDIDDDGTEILAGTACPSSGPPLGPTVLKFRRASVPPRPAAEASPPEASATILPLGPVPIGVLVQAVVLRLKDSRVRLKVTGPAREVGEDLDRS